MVKEGQAGKVRCCGPENTGALIGDANGDYHRYCIGSKCMAWRWVSQASMNNPTRQPGAGIQTIKQEVGYCGLAGPV